MNLPGIFFLTLLTTEREQKRSDVFLNLTLTTNPLKYWMNLCPWPSQWRAQQASLLSSQAKLPTLVQTHLYYFNENKPTIISPN